MYPKEYTLTESIGEMSHVTSFSLYFSGTPLDSHFFHVLHPTNPTKVPSLESPGVVAVVGRRINNRIPKTAGNKADTSHFNPNFHWDY